MDGRSAQAVQIGVQLIGTMAGAAGKSLIGGKRPKSGAAGLIGKTMRPMGGRRFGL
ncbi:hypothetical protein SAMN05519105_2034 [Rhodobacter sp. 24-YEA-8]|nr:hypothetical protein SAMN05519105_2034 [Rhodobacter sp. 24-YEA-8]